MHACMYVCFIVIPPRCINQWSDIQSCRAVLDPLQATNMIASVAHRIRSARGGWARGSRVLKPFGVERGRFLEARVLTCGLSAFAVQSSCLWKSPVTLCCVVEENNRFAWSWEQLPVYLGIRSHLQTMSVCMYVCMHALRIFQGI